MIDQIVDRSQLRGTLANLLELLERPESAAARKGGLYRRRFVQPESAWGEVELARHSDRPTGSDYIAMLAPDFVELHGDRVFGDDPALIAGLGQIGDISCVILAQERGRGLEGQQRHNAGQMHPRGTARRLD